MLPLNNNQAENTGSKPINVSAAPAAAKGGAPYAKILDMLTVFAFYWYWFVICLVFLRLFIF